MDGHLDLAELEALYSSLSPQERDELLQCLLIAARVGLPTPPPEILPGWFPRLLPQEQSLRRASLWDVSERHSLRMGRQERDSWPCRAKTVVTFPLVASWSQCG
jgi:hypothetical protein